jgi:carbon storage regulator
MLVLSRKAGEVIVIGDNIRLTVLAIRGNQVRLGVAAPVEIAIRRDDPGTVFNPLLADNSRSENSPKRV